MQSETMDREARAMQLDAMREDLDLYQRLLSRPEESSEKRAALLRYCARQKVGEPEVWWNLAVFRETGAQGLLEEEPPNCFFDFLDQSLKVQILSEIRKIPLETLEDFRELVSFTLRFLDRAQFLCDFLLHLFLQREKGAYRDSLDMSGYMEFFVQRMFHELDRIHEITNLNLFCDLNRLYEQWLCDKLADEQVLI
jgi:hypothetical protein